MPDDGWLKDRVTMRAHALPTATSPFDVWRPVRAGRGLWRNYRRAGWSLIDQSIVSIANFLSILLLARFLSAIEFGAFALAHTGLLLVTSLQTSLFAQPHNVLGAKLGGATYRRFTGALILAQLPAAALVCGLLAGAGYAMTHALSERTGTVLIALACAAFPWMAQEFVRRVLYTTSESRSAAANDFLCYGLQLAGVAALVTYADASRLNAVSALGIFGASSLVAAVFGAWQLRRQVSFAVTRHFRRHLLAVWVRVWKFGRWLLGQNISVWLGANGHIWVVGALLGTQAVGLYRAAIHLVNVINPLRQAAYVYLPARGAARFKSGGYAGLSRWVRRVLSILLLPALAIAMLLALAPEKALSVVYGDKFDGMGLGIVLALAAVAQIVAFLRYPMEVAVLAAGAPRTLFYIHLLPIALLLTLGIVLIAWFGIVGVALSMLSISALLFVATTWVYRRVMRRGPATEKESI